MRFFVDMNLAPAWVDVLRAAGWDARHWSQIGDPRATDAAILDAAREADAIVLTRDLDFGRLLALTRSRGPSVVLLRAADVTLEAAGAFVVAALDAASEALRRRARQRRRDGAAHTRAAAVALSIALSRRLPQIAVSRNRSPSTGPEHRRGGADFGTAPAEREPARPAARFAGAR